MSEANVSIGNIANAVWYTDKAEIVTGNTVASYNIYEVNVAQPVILGGFVVSGSAALTTTYTGANILGCAITGTGIAANTTISSQTKNSDSVSTSFTLSANATANNGNVKINFINLFFHVYKSFMPIVELIWSYSCSRLNRFEGN